MVKTCCVKNCNIESNCNITCFRFPTSRLLKRQWIDAIGLSNKLTANSLICIRHFQQEDYDIIRGRPRLKAKVIPSIFSELENNSSTPVTEENSIESFTESNVNIDNNDKIIAADNDNSSSKDLVNDVNRRKKDKVDKSVKDIGKEDDRKEDDGKEDDRKEDDRKEDDRKEDDRKEDYRKEDDRKEDDRKEDDRKEDDRKEDDRKEDDRKEDDRKEDDRKEDDRKEDERKEDDRTEDDRTEDDKLNKDNIGKDRDKIDDRNGHEGDTDERDRRKTSKPNGVVSNSLVKSTSPTSNSLDDLNKDIEEIITNYQIKQTRPVHNVATNTDREETRGESKGDGVDSVEEVSQTDPVFIEVSVQGRGDRAGSPRDCLMVLESVQVELDPSSFLTADGEHPDEDCHETVDLDDVPDEHEPARSSQDPISLLTSSDDDEVIIQEPHIDTVEVSDETDEDDLPLVKLLKRSKKKEKPVWKTFFYCMFCQYTTSSSVEYQEHVSKHSTVLHVCQICDYTTASKTQFARHKRKHKDDKKYKCHLCEYKARHNMSLIYHLKSHRAVSSVRKGLKCDKCGFKSDVKSAVLKHVKLCSANVKMYSCEKCVYETKRISDLRRHIARRHT